MRTALGALPRRSFKMPNQFVTCRAPITSFKRPGPSDNCFTRLSNNLSSSRSLLICCSDCPCFLLMIFAFTLPTQNINPPITSTIINSTAAIILAVMRACFFNDLISDASGGSRLILKPFPSVTRNFMARPIAATEASVFIWPPFWLTDTS